MVVMTEDNAPPSPAPGVPPASSTVAPVRVVRLRELSPTTMWWTAAVIAALTAGAVVALWWPATRGLNGAELVTARLDALKIGLSIGVGSGGVIALYLAWRRQHSTEADLDNRERALAHQQHDAAERRLTELYLKAVEQLGSAQAAVRHGGLYALERVAQDNPSQRQTVVDVICAYLRSPFTPPPDIGRTRPLGVQRPLLRSADVRRATPPPPGAGHAQEDRRQEREVRLTAQRILHRHLQPGDDPDHPRDNFWADIDLDLTGATLIDFALTSCRVATTAFKQATFSGGTWLSGTTFNGDAEFGGVKFADGALFDGTTFTGDARFDEAAFTHVTWFSGATFTGAASFKGTTFTHVAWFDEAMLAGGAWFEGATFTGDARFDKAAFTRGARFDGTTFSGGASFDEATFAHPAGFGSPPFLRAASFDRVAFNGDTWFEGATFNGDASFDGTSRQGLAFDPVEREAQPPDKDDPRPAELRGEV